MKDYHRIFHPICINNHWILLYINKIAQSAIIYDSLDSKDFENPEIGEFVEKNIYNDANEESLPDLKLMKIKYLPSLSTID